jgi:hypothetical protein
MIVWSDEPAQGVHDPALCVLLALLVRALDGWRSKDHEPA